MTHYAKLLSLRSFLSRDHISGLLSATRSGEPGFLAVLNAISADPKNYQSLIFRTNPFPETQSQSYFLRINYSHCLSSTELHDAIDTRQTGSSLSVNDPTILMAASAEARTSCCGTRGDEPPRMEFRNVAKTDDFGASVPRNRFE